MELFNNSAMPEILRQIIPAANVELNTKLLDIESGATMFAKMGIERIKGTSINIDQPYVCLSTEPLDSVFYDKNTYISNHFVQALSTAYMEHKPIVLKPDFFWLLICQGFAEHYKMITAQSWVGKTFWPRRKKTIVVGRNDFVLEGENPWEDVFVEFTQKVGEVLRNGLVENIALSFSTSTPKEKIAFEMAVMDSVSNLFEFNLVTICGIPAIELQGTPEDYRKMIFHLKELRKYGLEWWIDRLLPIMEEIHKASMGVRNERFWKSIFMDNGMCGGGLLTGWITSFFPYITEQIHKELPYRRFSIKKVKVRNRDLERRKKQGIKLEEIPCGISRVPFKWQLPKEELKMLFMAGFIGLKENPQTHYLEPEINWVVARVD